MGERAAFYETGGHNARRKTEFLGIAAAVPAPFSLACDVFAQHRPRRRQPFAREVHSYEGRKMTTENRTPRFFIVCCWRQYRVWLDHLKKSMRDYEKESRLPARLQ